MATSESTVIVKAIDQLMLTDITDSYSVELSKDTYVFTGDSPAGASSGSCSIDIRVYRGSEELKNVDEQNPSTQILTVQQLPAIGSSEPISATIDSNSGKWINDTSTTPTTRKWVPFKLNVSIKANETLSTVKEIPLKITIAQTEGQSSIELSKTFTVTVSKAGSTVVNTTYYYGYSNNGTNPGSVPAAGTTTPGHWQTSPWSVVPAGSYYWTQTNNIFSDNHTATTYSVTYIPYGGYGVSLKNDTHTFTAGVSSSTTVTAEVYKGSTALSYEFGLPTIPSALSGKLSAAYGTTSGGQQDKTKLVITAAVNLDAAGIANGELTIPITTELEATSHLTFNRQFAWSLTSSSYTWIKYAPTDDTTIDPTDMTDTPQDDTKYVGMAITKTNSAPTAKSSYTWSKYMGDDGFSIWTSSANLIDVAGHEGEQYYVKVTDLNEYSANGPKPKVNDILIWNSIYQYKIRAIETFNTWQVVKIYSEDRVSIKGDPGDPGVSPTIYWLDVSNATIVRQNNASPYSYSPSSITFVAKTQTGTTTSDYTAGSYRILVNGTQKSWVDITESNSGTYNLPTDTNINSVKIELYKEKKDATTQSLLDAENLAIAVDGQDGQDGQDGYLVWNVVAGHSPHNDTYSGSSKKCFYFGGSNNDLVAQGSAIPRVNEHIVQADRYQYTIDAVTDESNYKKVWINTGIDLKATNKASITFYTRSANQPSGKPFSASTDYTFANHSFSTSPVQGWSTEIPGIVNTTSLWSSYVEVSSKEDTVTIASTDWSTPTKVMEDAKWISISAIGGQEFISRDGGNTYSPDSIKLTPEFQNTTWWTDSTTHKVGWAYSTDGGVQYTDIVSNIAPWNDRYNSVTHTLTIQKGDVSDAASGSAIFKNKPIIIFRCKAVETDASGNNLVDYYTIVKNKDDKAIADEDIQYAKSSSGASPPDESATPNPWVDDIEDLGTVQPGWFLWTRMRFKYADNTYGDYTYTKSLQGVTGVGITSVTRLNFLVGPIYKGYLYQGTFYEDVDRTKPITPIADAYYFDQTGGQNIYYRYEDSTFVSKGASLQPSAPSSEITTSTDIANEWTKGSPHYIDGGQYYTCEQVKYDNNTFSWSAVMLDNMVTNAYIEIDRQQGEIDIVSEKIVNLEQTDEITSSVLTLTQPAYVGSLHELHIAPTMATGRGSISSLYPKTTLYPSNTLYPREPILIVESSNAAYGTKYQYHLDIDALSWTSSTCYDEFVYQDGRCWIVRRTMSGNNVVETIEARQNITPVNKVITVSGEEITVPDDVITIPTSTGITLKLYGANEEEVSNCNFKYKAIYLTDNPYTSNFTSNLDLISRINIAPGNIKIQAKNIQLEGYTTINEGFKIDLQGNMECQDATINGSLVTKDGVLTMLTFPAESWGFFMENLRDTLAGNVAGNTLINSGWLLGWNYNPGDVDPSGTKDRVKNWLIFELNIPKGFLCQSAIVSLTHMPVNHAEASVNKMGSCKNLQLYPVDIQAEMNAPYVSGIDAEYNIVKGNPIWNNTISFGTDTIEIKPSENFKNYINNLTPGIHRVGLQSTIEHNETISTPAQANTILGADTGLMLFANLYLFGYINIENEGGE